MATVNAVMEMKFYVHLCEISLNSHSSYICSCVCLYVWAYIYGYVGCLWLVVLEGTKSRLVWDSRGELLSQRLLQFL